MNYEELKAEFYSERFKSELIEKLGKTCASCGCITDQVEYHHIVSLELGGDNRLSNIVPLCCICHCKAHDKRMVRNYRGGRPKIVEYIYIKDILDSYFKCRIGKARTLELVGLSPTNKSSWYELTKRYKKENGIVDSRNNIDVIMSNKVIIANEGTELSDDRILGYIKYQDGKKLRFTKEGVIVEYY